MQVALEDEAVHLALDARVPPRSVGVVTVQALEEVLRRSARREMAGTLRHNGLARAQLRARMLAWVSREEEVPKRRFTSWSKELQYPSADFFDRYAVCAADASFVEYVVTRYDASIANT